VARVVVVGAGLGGLAAAARLATQGHAVTVLEAAPVVGGKAGVHAAEGFRFDTGPTLLTMPQVFSELFADTGDDLDTVVDLSRINPAVHYRFADGAEVRVTDDARETAAAMTMAFGPGAGAEWTAVLERGERIWRAIADPVLRRPVELSSLARRAADWRDLAAIAPGQTLRGLARRQLTDPRQRMILERYSTYAGSDPRRTPAALAVIAYLEQAFGSWHVIGGIHRLVEAVRDRAIERGAKIHTSAIVTRIGVTGNQVRGVELSDGAVFPADVVVANADADAVYDRLLHGHQRRGPRADSMSGFVVLVGCREAKPPDLAVHNVFFGAAPYRDEFDAIFAGRLAADPVIYLHSTPDDAAAPPGHRAYFLLVNAARQGDLDWTAPGVSDGYADLILRLLETRGSDLRHRLVYRKIIAPSDLESRTRAPGGAIYGEALHSPLASLRRARNRTRINGLYLVGGSTHPGGGLPLVTLSAAIVAELIGPA
jgi:phytoene desaturase